MTPSIDTNVSTQMLRMVSLPELLGCSPVSQMPPASVIVRFSGADLPARRSSHSQTLPFNLLFVCTSSRRASRLLYALRTNLRRLFASFCRIDDEFEWIRVLILFHQFQIGESPGALYGLAAGKLR